MRADTVGTSGLAGGSELVRRPFSRLEVGCPKLSSLFFDSWDRLIGLNPIGSQIIDRVESAYWPRVGA